MEGNENTVKLYYNTEVEKLDMPEYGRIILKMVERVKSIPDKAKRTEQAAAVVKAMEILNPQVHQQDNYEQKLWDHLHMIAGYDLDIDSPYPAPVKEERNTRPEPIPLKGRPIRARHYGRNIESIIDLIATEPDGEVKTAMIRSLAIYMRQQYLIWNKDSVADKTIFDDIERMSGGRVTVPEGLELSKISSDKDFSRPGMNLGMGGNRNGRNRNNRNRKKNKQG
ncbi:MAG: DUF4290 domain-containing protein [Bacteroidales bacterium]|jgi:hypothetical protein|nr:DUF4290 domain-containing protein [Bacteroidales bacterium]